MRNIEIPQQRNLLFSKFIYNLLLLTYANYDINTILFTGNYWKIIANNGVKQVSVEDGEKVEQSEQEKKVEKVSIIECTTIKDLKDLTTPDEIKEAAHGMESLPEIHSRGRILTSDEVKQRDSEFMESLKHFEH